MTNFSSPLVIGLDCSTSACKAIIWDCAGNPVSKGVSTLSMITPRPVWHEQPAESWWTGTVQALRQAVSRVDPHRVKALCIAHQRETFVPVDKNGQPLINGILWMDERASELIPNLERTLGAKAFHHQTGKRLSVNLTVAKIAWLRESQPDIYTRAFKFLDVHAFLVHRLTGLYRTSWGSADPTGLFDLRNKVWSESIIKDVGITIEQLPELYPPGTVLGSLSPDAAATCALPSGLPIVAGIGDGQACGLGVNITLPGDTYLSLGTSLISGTYSDQYVVDAAFRTMSGGIAGSYLLETALLGGTYTLTWFLEKLAARPDQELPQLQEFYDRAASEVPPGSNGLVVVPYWNSVLGPYWDSKASGAIVGWRGFHGLPHVYRAILEGLAFEQFLNTLGVEKALCQSLNRYLVTGGGAQSDCWCQIIADVTGKPVYHSATNDAAALGAGILAASTIGYSNDTHYAAQKMTGILPQSFEPDPNRHLFYKQLFDEVYQPLFPALRPYLDRLSQITTAQESGGG